MTSLIILCILLFCFLGSGCNFVSLVGNSFCNDETNNADCNYDGGDCCVVNAKTEYCSECLCHLIPTCAAGNHPWVGNEFCNDDTNILDCDYDGGDCCVNVNTTFCSECNCLGSGIITSPGFPGNYDDNLDLTWRIQVQIGQLIDISFIHFALYSWWVASFFTIIKTVIK